MLKKLWLLAWSQCDLKNVIVCSHVQRLMWCSCVQVFNIRPCIISHSMKNVKAEKKLTLLFDKRTLVFSFVIHCASNYNSTFMKYTVIFLIGIKFKFIGLPIWDMQSSPFIAFIASDLLEVCATLLHSKVKEYAEWFIKSMSNSFKLFLKFFSFLTFLSWNLERSHGFFA
jgi:hypothetical protein